MLAAVVGRWGWGACLVLVVATLPYWGALNHGFHYDDFHSIVHNPSLREWDNIPAFFSDPSLFSVNPNNAMYRPVLLVSYALNYAWGAYQPSGYHLVNLLIHGINAVLVLTLARGLAMGFGTALVAAILFGLTPLNSEAVHYISSRSEILMASFFLAACVAYLRFSKTGALGWYGLALITASLALLTKSVAIVLPGVLLCCDALLGGMGAVRRSWWAYLPFVGLGLIYFSRISAFVNKAMGAPVRGLDVQLWTQIKAQVYYIFWTLVPIKLSVERQFFTSDTWANGAVLAALALLGSLVFIGIRYGKRQGRFAAAWWLMALLPTLIVPLIVLVNEHRLYLSLVGWAMGMAWLGNLLWARARLVAIASLGAYTILLLLLTFQRSAAWADELSLWKDASLKGPLMVKPHLRLADQLTKQGQFAAAETAFRDALALRPQHLAARNNLGRMLLETGRLDEAEAEFRYLLSLYPEQAVARFNLAKVLLKNKGDWQGAAAQYRYIVQQDSTNHDAWEYLGQIALAYQQDYPAALDYFNKAMRHGGARAGTQVYVNKAVVLNRMGLGAEAEAVYLEVLAQSPAHVQAWFNLGTIYWQTGQYAKARMAYTKVTDLGTDPPLSKEAERRLKQPIP